MKKEKNNSQEERQWQQLRVGLGGGGRESVLELMLRSREDSLPPPSPAVTPRSSRGGRVPRNTVGELQIETVLGVLDRGREAGLNPKNMLNKRQECPMTTQTLSHRC